MEPELPYGVVNLSKNDICEHVDNLLGFKHYYHVSES